MNRQKQRRFSRVGVVALSAALAATALAGCGNGDAAADTPDRPVWQGPLDVIMDEIWAREDQTGMSREDVDAQLEEQIRAREQVIADCMAEQGFDYIPNVGFNQVRWTEIDPAYEHLENGTREWAELFGYGIARSPWITDTSEWFDPNAEQVNAMSPEQRRAWDIALTGDWETRSDNPGDDEFGCMGRSWALDNPFDDNDGAFAWLNEEINAFWQVIWNFESPEFEIMFAEWRTCMDAEGFGGHANPDALRNALETEWGNMQWEGFDFLNWDWDSGDTPDAPGVDEAPALEFHRREVQFAVADHDCQAAVNLWPRQLELNHRLQAEFVEENRAEIDAWLLHLAAVRAPEGES